MKAERPSSFIVPFIFLALILLASALFIYLFTRPKPVTADVQRDGDVTVSATSQEDVVCADCPPDINGEKKGTKICYEVTLAQNAENVGARDFHVQTNDANANNFQCALSEKYNPETKEWETAIGWGTSPGDQVEGETNKHYISWETDEPLTRILAGDTFRFCVVYCGATTNLDNTVEWILTTDGKALPGVPNEDGNRSSVPDVFKNGKWVDDPGWSGTKTTPEGSKVGFSVAVYPPDSSDPVLITEGGVLDHGYGLNEAGTIVGSALISGTTAPHAFVYSDTVFLDLGTLGGSHSHAHDINDAGQVVGWSAISDDAATHAFLYSEGLMMDLEVAGKPNSYAHAINNLGQVVGWFDLFEESQHAFLWQDGMMSDLGTLSDYWQSHAYDINDAGQVVGEVTTFDGMQHAFLWQEGELTVFDDLIGYGQSGAHAINELGQIVGWMETISGTTHAFIWEEGELTDLHTIPGYENSRALDINEQRQVVGLATNASGDAHAFIFSDGVAFDAEDIVLATTTWVLEGAWQINNQGDVVGWGTRKGDPRAFFMQVVPGEGHVVYLPTLIRQE